MSIMNRILIAGTAIAGLLAGGAATAQPVTNTPALLSGPTYSSGWGNSPSVPSAAAPVTPVDLGGAGHFVILSKTGITDVSASKITGNVGTSPITGAADHLSCAEVTGRVYSVDATGPAPCSLKEPSRLTNSVGDMQTAYTNAAGRRAKVTELGAGDIGGLTLAPGVYSWSTSVSIPKDVTLKGGSHAVWIFQISKNLVVASGKAVILGDSAQAQNVFWQVAGKVTLGTTSHFEGIILSKTLIGMQTGASIDGRLFSQTAVTLQKNSVTAP
jgi:Ice-binding-like